MKVLKFNKVVLIYFAAGWLIGIFIVINMVLQTNDDCILVLIFISAFNLIINLFSMLLLFAFIFIFPENRVEFKNSLFLLMFNFPNLFFLFLTLSII